MRLSAFTIVCRVAALVILCLTAFDLSNPALCALDGERTPAVGSAAPTIAAQPTDAGPRPATNVPVHIDDCFCCSACVDVHLVVHTLPAALFSPASETLPNWHVPLLARVIFHPPQLLS